VHLFWSSHEEKYPWLELSMEGGHRWTSSSMADHGGARRRGKRGERGGGERGAAIGVATGAMGRGCKEELSPCGSMRLFSVVREEEVEEREEKEKREKMKTPCEINLSYIPKFENFHVVVLAKHNDTFMV
jgi:hypothetical protein